MPRNSEDNGRRKNTLDISKKMVKIIPVYFGSRHHNYNINSCWSYFDKWCGQKNGPTTEVPLEQRWGIYELDLNTTETRLIYSTPNKISGLRLSNHGNKFVFSHQIEGAGDAMKRSSQ